MNFKNNNLKVPLLDAIDRFTIITLKKERVTNETDKASVEKEFSFYKDLLDSYRNQDGIEIKEEWISSMKDINSQIWDVESDIRNGRRNNLSYEDLGKLAFKLRDLNNSRVEYTKDVRALPFDFFDFDQDKISEDTKFKMPLHELVDKITITMLKVENAKDENRKKNVEKEYRFYSAMLDAYRNNGVNVKQEWIDEMKRINKIIWDKEDDVRSGNDQGIELAELGERFLNLRDLSKVRVSHKNFIAKESGQSFYEVKNETT